MKANIQILFIRIEADNHTNVNEKANFKLLLCNLFFSWNALLNFSTLYFLSSQGINSVRGDHALPSCDLCIYSNDYRKWGNNEK